jgi:hypothetical protein
VIGRNSGGKKKKLKKIDSLLTIIIGKECLQSLSAGKHFCLFLNEVIA